MGFLAQSIGTEGSPRTMADVSPNIAPISPATVINDRYEIRRSLGKGGMGEVFLAHDRTAGQQVALKIVREESRMPGDDEALKLEVLMARSVSHPNVCRVHDVVDSIYGPIMIMEHITGQTLHAHIRKQKSAGGYTPDEFRRIASETCAGVAAIHAQGLIHGDLKPGNVMVTATPDGSYGKTFVLDFGFAKERARLNARRPGAPPDGGTPNYMSPERMRSGGASVEDDIYALAMTLWEMWTCKVPEPGSKPLSLPMREQIMFDVPSGLSIDEVKQIFRCLADAPGDRLAARHLRFFNPITLTSSPLSTNKERLDPGTPPGRMEKTSFVAGAQSLLTTFASNAPEAPGELTPLVKPEITIGRRPDVDIVVAEPTVSGTHATLRWSEGGWAVEDKGSTNGSYVDHAYDRQKTAILLHGGEIQFGEMRMKLVSFSQDSPNHRRARAYLERRDGLTGVLSRKVLASALAHDVAFAEWIDAPLTLAYYELKSPEVRPEGKPTILEMLALRRSATRVMELTEMLLLAIVPMTAGRTGPLRFVVAMVGPSHQEAKNLVEQVVGQVQGSLPEGLRLMADIVRFEKGTAVKQLLDHGL